MILDAYEKVALGKFGIEILAGAYKLADWLDHGTWEDRTDHGTRQETMTTHMAVLKGPVFDAFKGNPLKTLGIAPASKNYWLLFYAVTNSLLFHNEQKSNVKSLNDAVLKALRSELRQYGINDFVDCSKVVLVHRRVTEKPEQGRSAKSSVPKNSSDDVESYWAKPELRKIANCTLLSHYGREMLFWATVITSGMIDEEKWKNWIVKVWEGVSDWKPSTKDEAENPNYVDIKNLLIRLILNLDTRGQEAFIVSWEEYHDNTKGEQEDEKDDESVYLLDAKLEYLDPKDRKEDEDHRCYSRASEHAALERLVNYLKSFAHYLDQQDKPFFQRLLTIFAAYLFTHLYRWPAENEKETVLEIREKLAAWLIEAGFALNKYHDTGEGVTWLKKMRDTKSVHSQNFRKNLTIHIKEWQAQEEKPKTVKTPADLSWMKLDLSRVDKFFVSRYKPRGGEKTKGTLPTEIWLYVAERLCTQKDSLPHLNNIWTRVAAGYKKENPPRTPNFKEAALLAELAPVIKEAIRRRGHALLDWPG